VFSVIVLLLDLGFLLTPKILLRPMHQVQRLKSMGKSIPLIQAAALRAGWEEWVNQFH
jgi:hypothetical protein